MSEFDMPDLTLNERQSLPAEIAEKLLAHILQSEIKPGTRMPSERQLAQQLNVGRSAVREALKSLGLLGMIEVRQGDGTYIKRPDSSLLPRLIEWGLVLGERRVMDLVEMREHLETAAAGSAAERRDDEDLRILRQLLDTMLEHREHVPEYVEADVSFHAQVALASKNVVLNDILTGIRSLLKVWMGRVAVDPNKIKLAQAEHASILEAIERQDPVAARTAMQDHLVASTQRLRETLPGQADDDQPSAAPPSSDPAENAS